MYGLGRTDKNMEEEGRGKGLETVWDDENEWNETVVRLPKQVGWKNLNWSNLSRSPPEVHSTDQILLYCLLWNDKSES